MKKKAGFTLMELLVVISIIGILVSISVASYSSAQKKGRDARRHADLKAVQNAWEQYYADHNANYPGTSTPAPCSLSLMASSATYLPGGFPVDPKSGITYPQMYVNNWSSCTSTGYCMCAGLEGEPNSIKDCKGGGAPTADGYLGLDCVTNLQ